MQSIRNVLKDDSLNNLDLYKSCFALKFYHLIIQHAPIRLDAGLKLPVEKKNGWCDGVMEFRTY